MRVVPRVKPRPLGDGVLFLEVEQVSKENEGYGSTLNLPATDFPYARRGFPKGNRTFNILEGEGYLSKETEGPRRT